MEMLEHIISSLDYILNTRGKRHIMGGILLSASTLFSGLAITVMTIKNDEEASEKPELQADDEEVDFYEIG